MIPYHVGRNSFVLITFRRKGRSFREYFLENEIVGPIGFDENLAVVSCFDLQRYAMLQKNPEKIVFERNQETLTPLGK